ncbi:MAG: germination protein [Methanococcus sp.]|jgi:germination protein M|nr:germination protein [Methanococcus sp.]
MINRRILIFGLIGLMVLSLFALGKKLISKDEITNLPSEMEIVSSDDTLIPEIVEEDGLRKTTMYFQDSNGYLVPVMRRIPWEEGIAKSTINNMVDSPELREILSSSGLTPIIPTGTKINGMTIDPNTGLCKVDFTAEFNNKENKTDFRI